MKYLPLIWAGLWRKPLRTVLTLLTIVITFFLFGILQGINLGFDALANMSGPTHLRVVHRIRMAEPLPFTHVEKIRAVPGVAAVSPYTVVIGTYQRPTNILVALGVDPVAAFAVYNEWKTSRSALEAMARTPTGAIVGTQLAAKYQWKVGDRIPLDARNITDSNGNSALAFDIVGLYEYPDNPSWANQMFVNAAYIDNVRSSGKGYTSQIGVRIVDGDEANRISANIDALFEGSASQTSTQSERDFLQSTINQIGNISFLVNGVVGAVMFTLLFLTGNTMMRSIHERIPEFAVLKTLGFSDASVFLMVLAESALLCVGAAILGLLGAVGIFPQLMGRAGALGLDSLAIPPLVFVLGGAIALVLAFVTGILPATRVRRLSIIDALAGR
jgi:putative ABC transport system permease protein